MITHSSIFPHPFPFPLFPIFVQTLSPNFSFPFSQPQTTLLSFIEFVVVFVIHWGHCYCRHPLRLMLSLLPSLFKIYFYIWYEKDKEKLERRHRDKLESVAQSVMSSTPSCYIAQIYLGSRSNIFFFFFTSSILKNTSSFN